MFAINPFYPQQQSGYDFDSLINLLNGAQSQQYHEQSKPKVVKKIETEEEFQIQIYKETGNFNNYEVKAVKVTKQFPQQPQLINVVLQSAKDQFKKTFQFREQDIKVNEINWEWYKQENILVLNIPKREPVCHSNSVDDLASLLLFPFGCVQQQANQQSQGLQRSRSEERAQAEAQEIARREAVRQAQEAELKAKREEEEKARRVAAERARREAEVRRRAEEERRAEQKRRVEEARAAEQKRRVEAARIAEAKRAAEIKRQAEERAKYEEQLKAREEEKKKNYEEIVRKQQEFLQQLFGGYLAQPGFQYSQEPTRNASPQRQQQQQQQQQQQEVPEYSTPQVAKEDAAKKVAPEPVKQTNYESDNESISSEVETQPSSPESSPKLNKPKVDESGAVHNLHKHPSLETVEDEEYVMFRKKFGDSK